MVDTLHKGQTGHVLGKVGTDEDFEGSHCEAAAGTLVYT